MRFVSIVVLCKYVYTMVELLSCSGCWVGCLALEAPDVYFAVLPSERCYPLRNLCCHSRRGSSTRLGLWANDSAHAQTRKPLALVI